MLKLLMAGRSGGRSWFGLALGFCLFAAGVSGGSGVAATAEDDLNAQHLVMIDDELVGDPREIPLIVETGSLRLEVVLEAAEGVRMILYNPSGLEAKLDEPNIAVTRVAGRHSVLLWDPRPGPWKVRLEGRGSYRLRVTTQGDLFVCCAQIFTRNQIFAFERSRYTDGSLPCTKSHLLLRHEAAAAKSLTANTLAPKAPDPKKKRCGCPAGGQCSLTQVCTRACACACPCVSV